MSKIDDYQLINTLEIYIGKCWLKQSRLQSHEDILRLALFRSGLSHLAKRTLNNPPGDAATVLGRSGLPGESCSANPADFSSPSAAPAVGDDFPEEAKP